jgi:hypothetical protein
MVVLGPLLSTMLDGFQNFCVRTKVPTHCLNHDAADEPDV